MNHFAVYSKLTQHCKRTLLQLKQKYMTFVQKSKTDQGQNKEVRNRPTHGWKP